LGTAARGGGATCSTLGAGSIRAGAGVGEGRGAVDGGGTIGLRTGALSTLLGAGRACGGGSGCGRVTNSVERPGGGVPEPADGAGATGAPVGGNGPGLSTLRPGVG
jgi:hypothetical protein